MKSNKKNSASQGASETNQQGKSVTIYLDLSELVGNAWDMYRRDFPNLSEYSFNVVGDTIKQIVFCVCRHVMTQLKVQDHSKDKEMDFALSMKINFEQIISETGVIIDANYVDELVLRVIHGIGQAFMYRLSVECPVVYNEGYVQINDFRIGTIVDDPEHLTAAIDLVL